MRKKNEDVFHANICHQSVPDCTAATDWAIEEECCCTGQLPEVNMEVYGNGMLLKNCVF